MRWDTAEKQGFTFTGACWRNYDTVTEARYKADAERIKKTFKGADYRIVTDTKNSWLGYGNKAILGNEVYNKVRYFDQKKAAQNLDQFADCIKELRDEYEQALEKLQAERARCEREYNDITALMKK